MHGYASQLAERVFSQLPVFLSAIKLEGKENKPEREATRLEAFKLIFITVVYVAQISLDESDFSRFIDCFKIVRFLTKTCLSSEDVFPAYIISSLRTMAMKASEVVEQESEISMIILNDYSRECLELEAMRDENEAIQNNGYLSAGIIVDRARSESHLIESDKPIKVKDLKSSCIIHEQKIKTRATEQSISRQSSIKIIPEVKNLVQNPADMTLKCHLKSFVSITKKHKQKNINSGPPTKQTDQSRPYHNMDQYFQMTMEKRLPAESIPNISYLDGYDKTFTKERKYWLANFTAKNSFNNVKAVKTQSKDMQSLVDANFKHTKVMIKVMIIDLDR